MNNETPERRLNPLRSTNGTLALLTDDDLHWFNEGTHCRISQKMGAHLAEQDGTPGVCFSVWAPNAAQVFVIGDFNGWDKTRHPLQAIGNSGVRSGFIPKLGKGATYKYHLTFWR
jgi:1,4-alpha-glucan branching enzyme